MRKIRESSGHRKCHSYSCPNTISSGEKYYYSPYSYNRGHSYCLDCGVEIEENHVSRAHASLENAKRQRDEVIEARRERDEAKEKVEHARKVIELAKLHGYDPVVLSTDPDLLSRLENIDQTDDGPRRSDSQDTSDVLHETTDSGGGQS